jgi:ribonuclease Z
MYISRVHRIVSAIFALQFVSLGLTFWVAPELAARRLGVEAVGAAGLSALRADLGGLFFGLALLCAAAAWTRQRLWLASAALMLSAIVVGRLIGMLAAGRMVGLGELITELVALSALGFCLWRSRPQSSGQPIGLPRPAVVAGASALTLLVIGLAALPSTALAQRLFDGAAERLTADVNTAPLVDDALRVGICGSSAPLPSARRAKACVAVFAGGRFYLVDVGPESVENLVTWGIPLSSVGGVLLTHFHSDHIGDLGELNLQTWAGGRKEPLRVYGGPGVDRVVNGFNDAYRLDQGYRTAHHGDKVMPAAAWPMVARPVELVGPAGPAKARTGIVLDDGSLRITAIEVDHAPIEPAYAYRFDYKGRSVVVSGDLKYHAPLARVAAGADLLVSEAISKAMTQSLGRAASKAGRPSTAAIMHDIEDYHITPEEAAQIANDARVKLLVFYHLLPAPDNFLTRRLFSSGVKAVRRGDWTMADDGSLYTLPIGSTEVRIGHVDS